MRRVLRELAVASRVLWVVFVSVLALAVGSAAEAAPRPNQVRRASAILRAAPPTASKALRGELGTRAAAAGVLLRHADAAKTAASRKLALERLLTAAEREPHTGLRGQMFLNLRARLSQLGSGVSARYAALSESVLPDRPPYQTWNLKKGLEVRHYVHEEFWKAQLASYRQHGFRQTGQLSGGAVVMEKLLVDPSGKNPPLRARVMLRQDEVELFRDADDPKVHMLIYSGHSSLGGNVSMSVQSGPRPRGPAKLIQMYMCRGGQNLEEVRRFFGDDAHILTSLDPSYQEDDDLRLFATYEMVARRGTYAVRRQLAGRSRTTRYLDPDDPRKFDYIDADRDGLIDSAGRKPSAVDPFFDIVKRMALNSGREDLKPREVRTPPSKLDGDKLTRTVGFANTVLFYHADESPQPRLSVSEVKDRFVPGGWFKGPKEEISRLEKVKGGKVAVKVNSVYSGQSRDALGALVIYDLSSKLLARRYKGNVRETVLRPFLFASLYSHYMTAYSDVADRVVSNLARKVGLPPAIDYGRMEKVIAADGHGYATDKNLAALERLVAVLKNGR